MVKAPYDEQVKVVRRALDSGINFFDTAFAYGLGKSEENLGRVLKEVGANPVISTKIRLEAEGVGDIKAATIRAVEDGLRVAGPRARRFRSATYSGDLRARHGKTL